MSIIIPVYNTEPWMMKVCFDSVKNQTYSLIEAIIVNDGSESHETNSFVETYVSQNSDIFRYYSIPHSGISAARNKGLEIAEGYYCCFLDSDDYYDNDFIETLILGAKSEDVDIVFCGYKSVSHNGMDELGSFPSECVLSDKNLYPYYTVGCGSRLYKTNFIRNNQVYFPIGCIEEDDSFTNLGLSCTDNFSSVIGYGYCIRQTRNSFSRSIHRIYSSTYDKVPFKIYERIVDNASVQSDYKSNVLMYNILYVMMWNSWLFCCNTDRYAICEMTDKTSAFVRKYYSNPLKIAYYKKNSISNNILIFVFCLGLKLHIEKVNSIIFAKIFKLVLLKRRKR